MDRIQFSEFLIKDTRFRVWQYQYENCFPYYRIEVEGHMLQANYETSEQAHRFILNFVSDFVKAAA